MEIIQSPLSKNNNVVKRYSLDIVKIKAKYLQEYNIDVTSYFKNVEELFVYECLASNLMFYHPFSTVSDGEFYANLVQNHKAYYNVWRWEHQNALDIIKPTDNVLEIGCGIGDFLIRVKDTKAHAVGLDLNPDASVIGQKRGLNIHNETIFQHSITNKNTYDVICAFQLFEHVNDVKDFLTATIDCLKKDGKLIIGVPNNDSYFFKNDPYHTLNLPPHHMLLWNPTSLAYIAKLFDLEILSLKVEPVSKVHKGMIYNLWLRNNMNSSLAKLVGFFTRFFIKQLPVYINDGIIALAIYRKI